MSKKINLSVTLMLAFIMASFSVSLAVKQFFILREQVYQDAFHGID